MLIQIDERTKCVNKIEGDAHVVLTIRADGTLILSAYRLGVWNTTYANAADSVIDEIPALVNELRAECRALKPKAQG